MNNENMFENADGFEENDNPGMGEDLLDDGFQRLDNGMGVNDNIDDIQKQNKMIAKTGAMIALGQGGGGNVKGSS